MEYALPRVKFPSLLLATRYNERGAGSDHPRGDLRMSAPPAANRPRAAAKSARKRQKPYEVSYRGMRSRIDD
jgi:hypothetical protein